MNIQQKEINAITKQAMIDSEEARRNQSKMEWAESNGLKEYTGAKDWLQFLTGKKPTPFDMIPYREAGFDHTSLWLKDGKPYCVLTQPYGISFEQIKMAINVAKKYELEFNIADYPSFHFDGVISIIWSKP